MDWEQGEFRITDDSARLDWTAIQELLRMTYWAADRPLEVMQKAVRGSLCLGLFHGGRQIGLARAITDYATFAWICDVIIHEDFRGRGLGKWLTRTLVEHPLLTVRSQYLVTEDAHGLYEPLGFRRFEVMRKGPPVSPAPPRAGANSGAPSKVKASATAFRLGPACAPPRLEQVRELFVEYAQSLGFSLCFQGFDEELATLPGRYAPPGGTLLLAEAQGEIAGCVAMRPAFEDAAEMKRLFVRPAWRGQGLGRQLAVAILEEARTRGYRRVVLDTLTTMTEACSLYRSLGFYEIPQWMPHPPCDSICMELRL